MKIFFLIIGLLSFMTQPLFSQAQTDTTNKPALVLVLLGPPGSGKGTQAIKVSQTLGIPHISTGDLFRYNIKNETVLGKKVKEYIDAGKLVPDSLVLEMLFDRLRQNDCKNGFLLDGSPRTVAQAEQIDAFLKTIPHRLVTINLVVSDQEVERRITGRRTCSKCGAIYHIESKPTKQENVCDACQGALTQRSDDTLAVVRERLKAYHEQTKPVAEYYRKSGHLDEVDGSKNPDVVFTEIISLVR